MRYGPGTNETLDIYPTPAANAPVLVFIHGGYWRSSDKSLHGFLAPAFNADGALVMIPNYALCPAVGIEHIALQLARCLAWVHRHAALYGGNPSRIVVAGHSAGAHLAAMSLTCHNCPDVVQALNLLAVLNPRIQSVVIDGGLFRQEVEDRQVLAVPMVYLNGQHFGQGRMEVDEIVRKLDTGAAARDAAKLGGKQAFDVLIVGGGPAGAAAAVYAARKGIRTGLLAERMPSTSSSVRSAVR